jgi:cytochrome oxidase Cu insertion factor (SCO1/SenC/PrrC family)
MRATRWVLGLLTVAMLLVAAPGCAEDTASDGDADEDLVTTAQDGLEVGETAPDFRLKNQDQATVELADFRGERNVILVFYPLAFTPV